MPPPYRFLCPYCFKEMQDDEVMFRSAKANDAKPVEKSVVVSNAQELVDEALPEDLPVEEDDERELLSYLRTHILEQLKKGKPVTPDDLYPNYDSDYDGDPYDDWTDFIHNFPDGALKTHLRKLRNDMSVFGDAADTVGNAPDGEDSFFDLADDPEYLAFWRKYQLNDLDLNNPGGEAVSVLDPTPWKRRILEPKNSLHQTYFQAQADGEYLIRDANGMVSKIQLSESVGGQFCSVRVCPNCHNPLPENYGKIPVKFLTLIGITSSGKTVYLSRLFQNMSEYMTKVRLSMEETASVEQFLRDNPVRFDKLLPVSTQVNLHQPLFFNLALSTSQEGENKKIKMETLVIYDVSGECFEDAQSATEYLNYAPFIQHSDGIMLLVDPAQIAFFVESGAVGKQRYRPSTALRRIRNLLTNGDVSNSCSTPVAVCISKMDELTGDNEPQNSADRSNPDRKESGLFPPELSKLLKTPIEGIRDKTSGFYAPLFNTEAYQPVLDRLYPFFRIHDPTLVLDIDTFYSHYSYFAFTALGCDVQRVDEEGKPITEEITVEDKDTGELKKETQFVAGKKPMAAVKSYRIEEPLLWLFTHFQYINESAPIQYPWEIPEPTPPPPPVRDEEIRCPYCHDTQSVVLRLEDRWEWRGLLGWFFRLLKIRRFGRYYNRKCNACGKKFKDEKTELQEQEFMNGAYDA